MSIYLSEDAAIQLNTLLTDRSEVFGLRIGVRTSGCYGMTYVMEFIDKPSSKDAIFKDKGINIIVDHKSLRFINGMHLDFVSDGLNKGFKFINPNAKEKCGCGESFSL